MVLRTMCLDTTSGSENVIPESTIADIENLSLSETPSPSKQSNPSGTKDETQTLAIDMEWLEMLSKLEKFSLTIQFADKALTSKISLLLQVNRAKEDTEK